MKNKKIEKYCLTAFFAVMLVMLLAQFSKVMVYFDDFGYYSLNYGVNIGHTGNEFTFAELVRFLKEHYFACNGRLPGYVLWLTVYILGGLGGVQVIAAVLLFAALYLLWKFDSEKSPLLSAVLIFAFYGLFTIEIQRQGTYWFAAFFQYVAPIAPLTLFYILYFKYREHGFSTKTVLGLAVLIFFSAHSQEQLSVTVCFSMVLLILLELIDKKAWKQNVLFLIIAILCALALILCPAAQNRAGSQWRTPIEIVVYSTYTTIHTFFSNDFRIFLCILFLMLMAASAELLKRERLLFFRIVDVVAFFVGLASVTVYCVPALQTALENALSNKYLFIICGGAVAGAIAVQLIRYYWETKSYSRLIVFMTAVGSIGCLCVVPEVPPRLFIPSWMLLFPTLADGVRLIANSFEKNKVLKNGIKIALSIAIVLAAIVNAGEIYKGYADNKAAFTHNDTVLTQAVSDIKSGTPVDQVLLKTFPHGDYCAIEPYNEAVLSMKHWICLYYELPFEVEFYYSEQGTDSLPDGKTYQYMDFGIYLES